MDAYDVLFGEPCPHRGIQKGFYRNVKTGDLIPATRPALAVHCPICVDEAQATLDREASRAAWLEDHERRLEQLEARDA